MRKRAKFLKRCKDAMWKRWTQEYIRGLRERHVQFKGRPLSLAVGDVVIIRSDGRNRGEWPLGVVQELYEGKDGIVRAVKLRAGKSYMERAVEHLYPLELSCDVKPKEKPRQQPMLNIEAQVFRPRRAAAELARLRNQVDAEEDA